MTAPAIRLRHLVFHGPNKEPAAVHFGPGLNVIYGASQTGKSFIVHAIDFMLGHTPPLPDAKHRIGYDRVLLGLESAEGDAFTLERSTDGGGFRLYKGLHTEVPTEDPEVRELADSHSERDEDNVSSFLLGLCGLRGKRVRRKKDQTRSLSFRRLSQLIIVNENDIIQRRSPLSSGNFPDDPEHFATFKMVLTGVDDSALVTKAVREPEVQTREAQIELLDELIVEFRANLNELTTDAEGLDGQLERLDGSISHQANQLSTTETSFRELADRRRKIRKRLEEVEERQGEVGSLIERFELLDRHYVSDVERLRGIEEGGSLFEVLGRGSCPLCGAEPAHHRADAECDANVGPVIEAARSEIAKIEVLRRELAETRTTLMRERTGFDRTIPRIKAELRTIADSVEGLSGPLSRLRHTYADLTDKRGQIRNAVSLRDRLRDIERRRQELETAEAVGSPSAVADADLPAAVAEQFAQHVEEILKAWHFPGAHRVYFDSKTRDLVISGNQRSAFGKGLRAITHSAFNIGLLTYCRDHETPHPGFVVIDSPLLAYREPDGADDDLTGVDLKEQFYKYLVGVPEDRQILIVENLTPPDSVVARSQTLFFSANPNRGRYGFFPLNGEAKKDAEPGQ